MVPTIDSVRAKAILEKGLPLGYPMLFPGGAGCGKTSNIMAVLRELPEQYQYISITFSAKTMSY